MLKNREVKKMHKVNREENCKYSIFVSSPMILSKVLTCTQSIACISMYKQSRPSYIHKLLLYSHVYVYIYSYNSVDKKLAVSGKIWPFIDYKVFYCSLCIEELDHDLF